MTTPPAAGADAVAAVWRIEAAKLIGGLARFTGDVGAAEELAQDALLAALEQWPRTGVPPNPGGWLMTTAKNRAADRFRREAGHRRAVETIGRQQAEVIDEQDALIDALDDPICDDILRLLFTACHPALNREYRIALTLRCVAGLGTAEIARASLVGEPVIGQRISRAKKTLRDKRIPFELPTAAQLPGRVDTVLEVIYLLFNEGYAATAGDHWMRPALADEALRLSRLTAALLPGSAEVLGLVALLELTQSRAVARTAADGSPVLLQDQDRRCWDALLIRRGLAALDRARHTGTPIGRYTLQAAISACHATAASAETTDWRQIAGLYDVLFGCWPTPIVQLNRAMAHGRSDGPTSGLRLLDEVDAASVASYPQLPAVRGELLAMAGRHLDAVAQFEHAAALTRNAGEQLLFRNRASANRAALTAEQTGQA